MGKPRISVICVTNRNGWCPILKDDMRRQTFRDFEVIVADDAGEKNYPDEWKVFTPRQKMGNDVWNLNKAYNDAISRAEGELLVFLQDFIWIPANGLQRFWELYEAMPDALVTGVGHKAKDGLEGISETDMRVYGEEDVKSANYTFWELNWASCPKAFMPRFNEKMDEIYGSENHYIARKCVLDGHTVLIDRTNRCIGYSQERCGGRPKDWEERHANKLGAELSTYMDDCGTIEA